ncbi:aminotransferase class V-fold PLP-dependent enzyme [Rhodobacterales bacterium HKCCE3408]|nr:aminotransferase class V-fold PLP-dependent enzyme [Rhodobacterales bacterium HKCCE3408]
MGLTATEEAGLKAAMEAALAYRRTDHDRPICSAEPTPMAQARFREPTPEEGLAPDAVIAELIDRIEPGLMVSTSPRFMGWVIGASHPAAVAADWLTSAWGQVASFADIAPGAAAAEEIAAEWLLDLLGLPPGSGLGFATGATMANFTALAAARTALLDSVGWDVEADGLFGAPEVNVVLGGEAHSSVYLSLRMLGFGAKRVHIAGADDQGRMRPDALAEVLRGLDGPTIVCLQAGNVNSGAFDPFEALVPIAHDHGAWVHVDGAFGLWAAAAPATRHLTAGMAEADSWAADAHKWLQIPYDCGVVIVRDRGAQQRAMGSTASYLPQEERRNPADYAPELSRRARGIAVWAALKALGRSGLAEMVERHCAVAREIAGILRDEPGLSVLNDVVLNQVVLACGEADDPEAGRKTAETLNAVQAAGICYPSAGHWRGRGAMRISVCSGPATLEDGRRSAEAIIDAWRQVSGG